MSMMITIMTLVMLIMNDNNDNYRRGGHDELNYDTNNGNKTTLVAIPVEIQQRTIVFCEYV